MAGIAGVSININNDIYRGSHYYFISERFGGLVCLHMLKSVICQNIKRVKSKKRLSNISEQEKM